MKWVKDLKVKMKLIAGFLTVAALMVVMGIFGLRSMGSIRENLSDIYENQLLPITHMAQVRGTMLRVRTNVLQHIIAQDAGKMHEFEEQIAKLDTAWDEAVGKFEKAQLTADEKVTLGQLKQAWTGFKQGRDGETLKLSAAGKKTEAMTAALGEVGKRFKEASDAVDKTFEVKIKAASTAYEDSNAQYRSSWNVTVVVLLTGAVVALFLGFMIARMIANPLIQTVGVLNRVAGGDLTPRLDLNTKDEVGQMGTALNQALDSLGTAMRTINESAQSVATSSEELTSVSHQMSSNSEETAAQANVVSAASEQVSKNVQTVAAGAEEMSASIKEIAKNTSEAARVAKEAVEVAEKTNQTITKLGESSAEIGNVIKVITSIAEQTNLLALNATIEAARAGEAGKGFAVVANEVKELAKQTRDATEDISQKIEAIQGSTQESVDAIGRITEVINQVNDIANTIASAVEEQSVTTSEMTRNVEEAAKGSNEIVANITGVAQAAQSTASGATQTQTAAQELARLASELQSEVGQFRYDEEVHETKPMARVKDSGPKAPRKRTPPTHRPPGATLHAL